MKIIFPSFAIFVCTTALFASQVVLAQSTAAVAPPATNPAPASAADPEALVQQMAAAIANDRSISARIRLHADLFGNQLVGAGVYLQQGVGTDRKMRLEIKIPVGERLATLQQVCDANFLWQYHDLSEKPALTRVDMHRLQEAIDRSDRKPAGDLQTAFPAGGLPQLIDGLRQTFHFTQAQAGQLDSLPVWIVDGVLRAEALPQASADSGKKSQQAQDKKLPPQMPEEVLLYLGQDDLFPYRIEYRRRPVRQGRGGAPETGSPVPILIVELYEVRLNSPIDPQQFIYQPGSLEVLDTTDQVLKGLKQSN